MNNDDRHEKHIAKRKALYAFSIGMLVVTIILFILLVVFVVLVALAPSTNINLEKNPLLIGSNGSLSNANLSNPGTKRFILVFSEKEPRFSLPSSIKTIMEYKLIFHGALVEAKIEDLKKISKHMAFIMEDKPVYSYHGRARQVQNDNTNKMDIEQLSKEKSTVEFPFNFESDTEANHFFLSKKPKSEPIELNPYHKDLFEKLKTSAQAIQNSILKRKTNAILLLLFDSGIQTEHPQLSVMGGYDSFQRSLANQHWEDQNGHGTMIASTAVGTYEPNTQTIGLAPGIVVWSFKVLDENGKGFSSNVIKAIDFLMDFLTQQFSKKLKMLANFSLGGPSNPILEKAIQRLIDKNIVCVAASGNSGKEVDTETPTSMTNVITVGALDKTGLKPASFSNFGDKVDVYAPGEDIPCTWIDQNTLQMCLFQGSSISSGLVWSTLANIWSQHPEFSSEDLVKHFYSNFLDDKKRLNLSPL